MSLFNRFCGVAAVQTITVGDLFNKMGDQNQLKGNVHFYNALQKHALTSKRPELKTLIQTATANNKVFFTHQEEHFTLFRNSKATLNLGDLEEIAKNIDGALFQTGFRSIISDFFDGKPTNPTKPPMSSAQKSTDQDPFANLHQYFTAVEQPLQSFQPFQQPQGYYYSPPTPAAVPTPEPSPISEVDLSDDYNPTDQSVGPFSVVECHSGVKALLMTNEAAVGSKEFLNALLDNLDAVRASFQDAFNQEGVAGFKIAPEAKKAYTDFFAKTYGMMYESCVFKDGLLSVDLNTLKENKKISLEEKTVLALMAANPEIELNEENGQRTLKNTRQFEMQLKKFSDRTSSTEVYTHRDGDHDAHNMIASMEGLTTSYLPINSPSSNELQSKASYLLEAYDLERRPDHKTTPPNFMGYIASRTIHRAPKGDEPRLVYILRTRMIPPQFRANQS